VGWDFDNIENRESFRKQAGSLNDQQHGPSKRLHDHQNDDPDHQDSGHLIDKAIESLTSRVPVGGEILDATGKKTVDARQQQHQQELTMEPAR
jgi:hypothetical protein